MSKKPDEIISKALWLGKKEKYNIDFFDILEPQRIIKEQSRYNSGTYYSEKCKREIQYESGLELYFIKQLEQSGKVLFYWEQPVQVQYTRGKIRDNYTPDFAIYLNTGEIIIVEIKDLPGMLDNRVQMKMEGLIRFCRKKGFGILLTNGKDTIDKIRSFKTNKELEKEILSAVSDNRVLRKNESRKIIKKHNATQNELFKVIFKNNLKYKSRSAKIEKENKNKIFRHIFINKKPYEELEAGKYSTLFKNNTPGDELY